MTLRKRKNWKRMISGLAAAALLCFAGAAFASAPTVVVDAQETLATGLSTPQSIVVAPNNTYYVADNGANQVLEYVNGVESRVKISGISPALKSPNALAVDSAGDLFIGDNPVTGTGRVIEAYATNGVLNGRVAKVVSGGALKDVTALVVDASNTLYIGDDVSSSIYTYTVAGGLTKLNLTGLPSTIVPTALAKDAAGNLYIAELFTTVYEVPANSTAATAVNVPNFNLSEPSGLAFDPKGNLYIMTRLLGTGVDPTLTYILEIPGGDWGSAFEVPVTGLANPSALAIDSNGTLYVVDYATGDLTGLIYSSAVNLGQAIVGHGGDSVIFNYAINAPIQSGGFQAISQGDVSAEIQNAYGTCSLVQYTDGDNGQPIAPYNPYTCVEWWYPVPAYPGIRSGAIVFTGPGYLVYAATPVFSTGLDGASVIYPLAASTAAMNISGPTGLVVSGLDQTLYIVDGGGRQILSTNGPDGTTLTKVNTGSVSWGIPQKAALNGNGDLYVADYGEFFSGGGTQLGQVVVVPRSPSETPYSFNPGSLLQHPLSIAFDTYGNLYIGDSGPEGSDADAENPGYIVEVPAGGGAPFKLNTGAVTIIYPQALATDPYTRDLYIGDGGDYEGNGAKVVRIPAGGGTPVTVTPRNVTQAVDIVFDPAEQYYVLDAASNQITVVRPNGTSYVLPFDNSLFTAPRALAITNGGQSFVEANLLNVFGNNLVFLNGKSSTLAFPSVASGHQSTTMTATVDNVGTTDLKLGSPYYTVSSGGTLAPFSIQGSTSCANRLSLDPASTCDIKVQFKPTSAGSFSKQLTLSTNGYLTNDSVLNLTGTGTGSSTETKTGRK